jgi:hypothetical protein
MKIPSALAAAFSAASICLFNPQAFAHGGSGGGGHCGGGGGHCGGGGHFSGGCGHFSGGHFWGGHCGHFHNFIGFGGGYWYGGPWYPYGDWGYGYDSGYGYPSSYGAEQTAMYYPQSNPGLAANSLAREVQQSLAMAGYYHGSVDGHIGPMTREAIGHYQNNHHLPVTNRIDESLLQSLRLL